MASRRLPECRQWQRGGNAAQCPGSAGSGSACSAAAGVVFDGRGQPNHQAEGLYEDIPAPVKMLTPHLLSYGNAH